MVGTSQEAGPSRLRIATGLWVGGYGELHLLLLASPVGDGCGQGGKGPGNEQFVAFTTHP